MGSHEAIIIEDNNDEDFGNDMVLELEQENQRLRHREEMMRREIEARQIEQQIRREQLLTKMRELQMIKAQQQQVVIT